MSLRGQTLTLLLCGLVLMAAQSCFAQQDDITISVDSRLVIVPVFWASWIYCSRTRDKELLKCSWDGAVNERVSNASYQNREFTGPDELGLLSLKDLRIFEDGREQKIIKVEKMGRFNDRFEDNFGSHVEATFAPSAIWSTSDETVSPLMDYSKLWGGYYQIIYSPSTSTVGSCHSIQIEGPHASKLQYRKQYCFVNHSTADQLKGTPEDHQLEGYLAAAKPGRIHPRMQVNTFFEAAGKARVQMDIELPFDEVKLGSLKDWATPVDVLILASTQGGEIAARHSERVMIDKSIVSPPDVSLAWAATSITYVRYEAQMELPPGSYKLAFAYSHGPNFGIAEAPLVIDGFNDRQLDLSSIALCKRVRKAGSKSVANEFVPLIAGNEEFTPTVNTEFHNADSLMAYFELYEPASGEPASQVNYTMRIRNAQTGTVVLERVEDAAPWVQPGRSTIAVAVKLLLNKLNLVPGKYGFEVEAADSSGRATGLRTSEFWIE